MKHPAGEELLEMLPKLILAFTVIPFVEIYLLMKVGYCVGALNTLAIVIVTGLLGAWLARMEGIRTAMRVRESLRRGELPAEEMLDAVLIFMAGVVLLTPGFVTDVAGVTILVPKTRYIFKRWLRKKFDEWVANNKANIVTF